VQLGKTLPGAAAADRRAGSKSLRELSVRVVALHTLKEQMEYDNDISRLRPGKPVEIILENDDAMPHTS